MDGQIIIDEHSGLCVKVDMSVGGDMKLYWSLFGEGSASGHDFFFFVTVRRT